MLSATLLQRLKTGIGLLLLSSSALAQHGPEVFVVYAALLIIPVPAAIILTGWRMAPPFVAAIWLIAYLLMPFDLGSQSILPFLPMYAVLFSPYVYWLGRGIVRYRRRSAARSNPTVESDARKNSAPGSP